MGCGLFICVHYFGTVAVVLIVSLLSTSKGMCNLLWSVMQFERNGRVMSLSWYWGGGCGGREEVIIQAGYCTAGCGFV